MTKELEAIKELRYIVLKFCEDNNKQDAYCIELCDTIKQALLKAQENEKALDKIKQYIKYDKNKMKFTLEIESDDFDSGSEWDSFKEVVGK